VVYLYGCDFVEVLGIRNTKASHPMLVAPLLEMALISPSPPVTVVATYFTLEFLMTNCCSKNMSALLPNMLVMSRHIIARIPLYRTLNLSLLFAI
jgi:hypothetical protein